MNTIMVSDDLGRFCFVDEGSPDHKKFQDANANFVDEKLETWSKPFDDYELLIYNVPNGREYVDLEHYVLSIDSFSCLRSVYHTDGIEGVRKEMRYQCLLDYYRASVRNQYIREGKIQEHETMTDQEIFKAVLGDMTKYTFNKAKLLS